MIEPLTREAFAIFGDVLELAGQEPELINNGLTLKYAPLSLVLVDQGASSQLCVYRSQPVQLPFVLEELERHPLAGQVFVPLHARPFPVVVAPGVGVPATADLRVFMTDGRQGINLKPGVWHHHQICLNEVSDFLVIERDSEDGNLETCTIEGQAVLRL